MLFKNSLFVGVDPSSGENALTYAALDRELNLIAVSRGDLGEVAAFAGGQERAFVGVNSPRRTNQGLMANTDVRDRLRPQPAPGRWTAFRVAEYELFQRNIRIPKTSPKEADCPGWMQTGFSLYKRLEGQGFKDFPANDHPLQILEVYPHAAYTILLEKIPFLKKTLEGRLQRQLLLHSLSVAVPDPMLIFEEITRYKIMRGQLPLDGLYSVEELEALMAAYTAWKAARKPAGVTRLGDPNEGEIILPGTDIKTKYF
jgi:hypothetical protein